MDQGGEREAERAKSENSEDVRSIIKATAQFSSSRPSAEFRPRKLQSPRQRGCKMRKSTFSKEQIIGMWRSLLW